MARNTNTSNSRTACKVAQIARVLSIAKDAIGASAISGNGQFKLADI